MTVDRDVDLLPVLRDVLADLKAGSTSARPAALVFATAQGRRFGESNLRRRVLAKAIEREQHHFLNRAPSPRPLDDGSSMVVPGR